MKGGNGATNGSAVTLRRATGVNPWVYCRLHNDKPGSRQSPAAKVSMPRTRTATKPKTLLDRGRKSAKEIAEASKNLQNVESPTVPLVRGRVARRSF